MSGSAASLLVPTPASVASVVDSSQITTLKRNYRALFSASASPCEWQQQQQQYKRSCTASNMGEMQARMNVIRTMQPNAGHVHRLFDSLQSFLKQQRLSKRRSTTTTAAMPHSRMSAKRVMAGPHSSQEQQHQQAGDSETHMHMNKRQCIRSDPPYMLQEQQQQQQQQEDEEEQDQEQWEAKMREEYEQLVMRLLAEQYEQFVAYVQSDLCRPTTDEMSYIS